MAQLFRVLNHKDSSETHTFLFLLPPSVAKENPPEIISRDFLYGGHKWRMCFIKREKHLSPYLKLVNCTEGMSVTIDYSFTLVNRDSFSKNESFSEKQRTFNINEGVHGHRTFVTLAELGTRNFCTSSLTNSGEFLFELTLRSCQSQFEQEILLNTGPPSLVAQLAKEMRGASASNLDYHRYDTKKFLFGDQEWNSVFCPNMDMLDNRQHRHMIQLKRMTKLDCLCKLRYRILLGSRETKAFRSDMLEEIIDFSGNNEGFYFTNDYFQYVHSKSGPMASHTLLIRIEFFTFGYVNQLKIAPPDVVGRNRVSFNDKDKQAWLLTSNLLPDERLGFSLIYSDSYNIPTNYLRAVSWSLSVLPQAKQLQNHSASPLPVAGAPFQQYYGAVEKDPGFRMETKLKAHELRGSTWLDADDGKLTVQFEWHASYLLLNAFYHAHDDMLRRHMMQMRREVQALQSENYQLEKELHNYQQNVTSRITSASAAKPVAHSSPVSLGKSSVEPAALINGINNHRGSSIDSVQDSSSQRKKMFQPMDSQGSINAPNEFIGGDHRSVESCSTPTSISDLDSARRSSPPISRNNRYRQEHRKLSYPQRPPSSSPRHYEHGNNELFGHSPEVARRHRYYNENLLEERAPHEAGDPRHRDYDQYVPLPRVQPFQEPMPPNDSPHHGRAMKSGSRRSSHHSQPDYAAYYESDEFPVVDVPLRRASMIHERLPYSARDRNFY